MPPHDVFRDELAEAARGMQDDDSPREAMERAVQIATKIIPGCRAAGICVVHRGERIDTHAASDDLVRRIDALQHELSEGPCLDALRQDHTVVSGDLATDVRWPNWGPQVVRELGLSSTVSYRLYSTDKDLGALSLYGAEVSAFTADDIADGLALAAHVAVALAAAQEVEHLENALRGRTVIGQATGVLMERFDLAPDRAFSVLSRLSQQKNVKLRDLAEQIVTTRTLPTA
ncbi:GAF and ANTAR domain-containing protein [Nocardioides sp. S5]|uniref:GAF and ANTAR domain-containing protein n=1 Tax=Nocardioides sp. S5 TaxID=2017486 RepID=UPI001A8E56E6|nr:GAF and ANTAR domain-containing protein [Nocardioides sp. S5]